MRCLYCNKRLWFYPLSQNKFCSALHENWYQEEQTGEAIKRLKEPPKDESARTTSMAVPAPVVSEPLAEPVALAPAALAPTELAPPALAPEPVVSVPAAGPRLIEAPAETLPPMAGFVRQPLADERELPSEVRSDVQPWAPNTAPAVVVRSNLVPLVDTKVIAEELTDNLPFAGPLSLRGKPVRYRIVGRAAFEHWIVNTLGPMLPRGAWDLGPPMPIEGAEREPQELHPLLKQLLTIGVPPAVQMKGFAPQFGIARFAVRRPMLREGIAGSLRELVRDEPARADLRPLPGPVLRPAAPVELTGVPQNILVPEIAHPIAHPLLAVTYSRTAPPQAPRVTFEPRVFAVSERMLPTSQPEASPIPAGLPSWSRHSAGTYARSEPPQAPRMTIAPRVSAVSEHLQQPSQPEASPMPVGLPQSASWSEPTLPPAPSGRIHVLATPAGRSRVMQDAPEPAWSAKEPWLPPAVGQKCGFLPRTAVNYVGKPAPGPKLSHRIQEPPMQPESAPLYPKAQQSRALEFQPREAAVCVTAAIYATAPVDASIPADPSDLAADVRVPQGIAAVADHSCAALGTQIVSWTLMGRSTALSAMDTIPANVATATRVPFVSQLRMDSFLPPTSSAVWIAPLPSCDLPVPSANPGEFDIPLQPVKTPHAAAILLPLADQPRKIWRSQMKRAALAPSPYGPAETRFVASVAAPGRVVPTFEFVTRGMGRLWQSSTNTPRIEPVSTLPSPIAAEPRPVETTASPVRLQPLTPDALAPWFIESSTAQLAPAFAYAAEIAANPRNPRPRASRSAFHLVPGEPRPNWRRKTRVAAISAMPPVQVAIDAQTRTPRTGSVPSEFELGAAASKGTWAWLRSTPASLAKESAPQSHTEEMRRPQADGTRFAADPVGRSSFGLWQFSWQAPLWRVQGIPPVALVFTDLDWPEPTEFHAPQPGGLSTSAWFALTVDPQRADHNFAVTFAPRSFRAPHLLCAAPEPQPPVVQGLDRIGFQTVGRPADITVWALPTGVHMRLRRDPLLPQLKLRD